MRKKRSSTHGESGRKTRLAADQQEQAFLADYDPAEFSRPSVTVDIVLLSVVEARLRVLVIQREQLPERNKYSLPGGFVDLNESLETCAKRVLQLKAELTGVFLEQLFTFGEPNRDPRMRIITVAYYALLPPDKVVNPSQQGTGWQTVHVPWSGETGGPVELHDEHGKGLPMAFDHASILGHAVLRLRGKLGYAPIGFELLPKRFTLRQLQTIHETLLNRKLNKDSFRRKVVASGLVMATGQYEREVGHRPAELYRFTKKPQRS